MMQTFTKCIASLGVIMLCGLIPAEAQIKNQSTEKHKREQRRFLKEAENTESEYKETHLNTEAYTFKQGEAARKRAKKRDERRAYKFDEAGKPVKKKGLFKRKVTKKEAGG